MSLGLVGARRALPPQPVLDVPCGPLATPCFCGGWLEAETRSWKAIREAVELHNRSARHQLWRIR